MTGNIAKLSPPYRCDITHLHYTFATPIPKIRLINATHLLHICDPHFN